MGLGYHDEMSVPRQGDPLQGGRVLQKQRTRRAVVEAAQRLLAEGTTPTVAAAATAAQVGRTTAYRYFPTQESLLVEVAMDADVDDVEELVAAGVDPSTARDRALAVLELFNRHVVDAEPQYRTALRLYLDQWLEHAEADGGAVTPELREGRRRRWFAQSLAPLRPTVTDEVWERVIIGLCLLSGGEARMVLTDVCRLDDDAGRDAVRWAAEALLDAAFGPR